MKILLSYISLNSDKKLRYVFADGFEVFVYRVWKLSRLQLLRMVGFWPKLHIRISRFWEGSATERWLEAARKDRFFIGRGNIAVFTSWARKYPELAAKVLVWAGRIDVGDLRIFEQETSFDSDNLPWLTDWRWPHTWENIYFRDNSYYAHDKKVPHDVKFPWEVSRFAFFIPLAQAAVLTGEERWVKRIVAWVEDWDRKNPIAYSINWCAMECAMRGLVLAIVVQILACGADIDKGSMASLLGQLALQGEFLFRNIEYTKVRSNHYAANLTALLVIGHTLKGEYRPAVGWVRHAQKRIFSEILSQFCEDGVNFEKSVSYHRLVTELFLLALLQMDHCNTQVPVEVRERIHRACEYSRWYTRPDGLTPNWGDNDSARLLSFDDSPLRNHGTILDFGAAFFADPALRSNERHYSPIVPLLLGNDRSKLWETCPEGAKALNGARFFTHGGMFVSRHGDNFFFADFGEVGTGGSGGHGHNDTFSFELFLFGEPVIIDRGSPVYTGDLAAYNCYRGTESHNVVRIDGQEMARMPRTWEIENDAYPYAVKCEFGDAADSVVGEHAGYHCLPDPVSIRRKFVFYKHLGRLVIEDSFICDNQHFAEHFFHLAVGLRAKLSGTGAVIYLKSGKTLTLKTPVGATLRIEQSRISDNYGHETTSSKIIMAHKFNKTTSVNFEIG